MTELALDGQKDGLGMVRGFLVEGTAYLEAYQWVWGGRCAFRRDSYLRLERSSQASIYHNEYLLFHHLKQLENCTFGRKEACLWIWGYAGGDPWRLWIYWRRLLIDFDVFGMVRNRAR